MADYEIRHGNFLAHLFNPYAAHGFGEAVLKPLFSQGNEEEKLALIVINGIGKTVVKREWRNIDILVELDDLKTIIVIELKVHAAESKDQLEKYVKTIESNKIYENYDKIFVFATPEGTEATHPIWHTYNMIANFIPPLKQIANGTQGNDTARAMLGDYVRIMEQKFMTDETLNKLAESLWARYPDALNFLADNRPDLIGRVFDYLYDGDDDGDSSVYDHGKFSKIGFDFSNDWDHDTNSRLICSFENWDAYPGMLTGTDKRLEKSKRILWLEIEKSTRGIRALFVIGPGDTAARKALLQALIDGPADTGPQKTVSKMTAEYSRLASVWLLDNRSGEHGLQDADQLSKQAVETLEKFLVKQLPKIQASLFPDA